LNISTRPEALNITGHTVLIGRDPGCDVAIEDDAISARHAIVFDIGGKRYVRDLNSRTGTFLNGSRVRQQEVLFGDQIRVGETRLEVIAAKPAAAKAAKPVAPAVVADAAPPKAEAAARMVVPPMVAALEPAAAVAASRVEPPAIEIKPAAAVAPAAPARAAVSPFAKGRPGAPAPLAAGPDEEIAPPPKPVRPAAPPVVMVFQPLVPAPELPRLMVLPPIPKPAPTAITTGAVPPPAAAVAPKGVERAPVKSEPVAGIAPAAELPRPAMAKPVAQPVVSRVEPPVVKVIEPPAPVAKVEMPGEIPLDLEPVEEIAPPPPRVPHQAVLPPVAVVETPAEITLDLEPVEEIAAPPPRMPAKAALPPVAKVEALAEIPLDLEPVEEIAAPPLRVPPQVALPPVAKVEALAEIPLDLEPVEEIASPPLRVPAKAALPAVAKVEALAEIPLDLEPVEEIAPPPPRVPPMAALPPVAEVEADMGIPLDLEPVEEIAPLAAEPETPVAPRSAAPAVEVETPAEAPLEAAPLEEITLRPEEAIEVPVHAPEVGEPELVPPSAPQAVRPGSPQEVAEFPAQIIGATTYEPIEPVEIEAPIAPIEIGPEVGADEIDLRPVKDESELEAPAAPPAQVISATTYEPIERAKIEIAEPDVVQVPSPQVEAPLQEFELDAPAEATEPVAEAGSIGAGEPPIEGLNLSMEDFPEATVVGEPAEAGREPEISGTVSDEVLEEAASDGEATLDLDSELPPMETTATAGAPAAEEPGDTEFGKLVQEFSGESTGPLVEELPVESAAVETEGPGVELPVIGEFVEPGVSEAVSTELTADETLVVGLDLPGAEISVGGTSDEISVETGAASETEPVVSESEPVDVGYVDPPVVSYVEPIFESEIELPTVSGGEAPVVSEIELPVISDLELAEPVISVTPVAPVVPAEPAAVAPPPLAPSRGAMIGASTIVSESFGLDDGFFSADLTANGIFIREGQKFGKPAVAVEAPALPPTAEVALPAPEAAPVAPEAAGAVGDQGVSWLTGADSANAENYLGGMPVNLAPPTTAVEEAGEFAPASEAKRRAGTRPPHKVREAGGVGIPQPPPKMRTKRATPFATRGKGISPDDNGGAAATPPRPKLGSGEDSPRGIASAFDGLAMPVRDVFSDLEATAMNDAAFGGARLSRGDDYILPESPESASRLSDKTDHDFAEDDFWNRTDEEEGLPPTGVAKGEGLNPPTNGPVRAMEAEGMEAPPETGLKDFSLEDVGPPATAADAKRKKEKRAIPPPVVSEVEAPVAEEVEAPAAREAEPAAPAAAQDDSDETWADIPVASAAPAEAEGLNLEEVEPVPAAEEIAPPAAAKPRRAGGRGRILPILMLTMLVSMGMVLAGIWVLIQPKSRVVGTLTYVNFDWVPGTDDGSAFEADQRRILESEQTHEHAREVLGQRFPGTAAGFLDTDAAEYLHVVSGVKLASAAVNGEAQTTLQLTADGADKNRDQQRMAALLQAVYDANAATLDDNRRVREIAQAAHQEVDDANQRLAEIKAQMPSLQRVIDQDPAPDELAALTAKKEAMQKARFDAEDLLDHDRGELERLQAASATATADPPAAPAAPDSQLEALRQQIVGVNQQLQEAKSQQSAGVADARSQLEQAVKQFNDQLSASDNVLDSGSQLRQFVDSAKDSQDKAREMITTMLVDGEDLQRQLEDTRRDVEEMIQSRQEELWADDTQLQQLETSLDGAQHRYNAAVGEGVGDQHLLDSLKQEIDDLTSQVKARKDALGVDPSEVRVADGLNKVIDSLRRKLQKEKDQIDEVLDPLQKQLAGLDGQVGSLPEAQQQMALQLRQSLAALNDARKNYAQVLGEGDTSPSAVVTNLEKQLDDLKARFDRRQADLAQQQPQQNASQLADAQRQFELDKQALEETKKDYEAIRVQYDTEAGQHEDADSARMQMAELTQELNNQQNQLEVAVRDRDQKQLQADRCFDIRPLTDADVLGTAVDPRQIYSLYAMGGLAVLFTLLTIAASRRAAERRPGRGAGKADSRGDRHETDDETHALPA
jgi:hypothetical protein